VKGAFGSISGMLASAEWASVSVPRNGMTMRQADPVNELIDETERAAGASLCVQSGTQGPGIRFSAGVTSPAERVETDITRHHNNKSSK